MQSPIHAVIHAADAEWFLPDAFFRQGKVLQENSHIGWMWEQRPLVAVVNIMAEKEEVAQQAKQLTCRGCWWEIVRILQPGVRCSYPMWNQKSTLSYFKFKLVKK